MKKNVGDFFLTHTVHLGQITEPMSVNFGSNRFNFDRFGIITADEQVHSKLRHPFVSRNVSAILDEILPLIAELTFRGHPRSLKVTQPTYDLPLLLGFRSMHAGFTPKTFPRLFVSSNSAVIC